MDDEGFRAFVDDLLVSVRALEGTVAGATSYYETGDEQLVSVDRHKTFLPVVLVGEVTEADETVEPLIYLISEAGREGFELLTVGEGSINYTFNELAEEDLKRGEAFGVPLALVILVLVFGAAVAAVLPLILAAVVIAMTVGTLTAIGQAFDLYFLVINFVALLGLALGIDYSLFIVHRFREERGAGLAKEEAIVRSGATAGRSVLFSGGTVAIGLLGLFVVPSNFYRSLAAGGIAVAIFAVLAALTLLPAILSLLGDRVDALRLPLLQRGRPAEDGRGFWGRVTSFVMAHPLISIAISASILVAATIPYFTINTGVAGVSTFPPGTDTRRAFEVLDRDFSAGLITPAEIVVDAPDVNSAEVQDGIDRLLPMLDADQAFGAATLETNEAGDLALVSVLIEGDPRADATHDAINRLRDDYIPDAFAGVDADVLVAGRAAEEEDISNIFNTYTPIVFAVVLGLSFLLLLLLFRSIVVPAKALVMNLLSVGAAYGLLVLVFQHGVGNEIFGFQRTETIEAWLPLLLFAVLFGLSLDYHVFMLSRIRERFDQTGDNSGSVAYALRSTAGVITGAALIMVAVFSGFAMGDSVALQQWGFGLAVGVILDATIVRSVLVPATMRLLGDLNWYLPKWLQWLPEVRVEGAVEPVGAGVDAVAGGSR